jgi:HK97 family phage prohead protease
MPNKAFPFEIKALSEEEGTFEGMASVYGNLDATGDIVDAGAFDITLRQGGRTRPLLFSHSVDEPVGSVELTDTPQGLQCKGRLVLQVARAKEILALMKQGILKGLSIGYQAMKAEPIGGVRHLQAIRLLEVSLCLFPANELATVSAVKQQQHEEQYLRAMLNDIRREIQSKGW